MNNFEKAKQDFQHGEYQKAFDLIVYLINNNVVPISSPEYPDILWYLGNCRLNLYNISKNKSLVFDALTDFATAANAYYIHHNNLSDNLRTGIKKCIRLI